MDMNREEIYHYTERKKEELRAKSDSNILDKLNYIELIGVTVLASGGIYIAYQILDSVVKF